MEERRTMLKETWSCFFKKVQEACVTLMLKETWTCFFKKVQEACVNLMLEGEGSIPD